MSDRDMSTNMQPGQMGSGGCMGMMGGGPGGGMGMMGGGMMDMMMGGGPGRRHGDDGHGWARMG